MQIWQGAEAGLGPQLPEWCLSLSLSSSSTPTPMRSVMSCPVIQLHSHMAFYMFPPLKKKKPQTTQTQKKPLKQRVEIIAWQRWHFSGLAISKMQPVGHNCWVINFLSGQAISALFPRKKISLWMAAREAWQMMTGLQRLGSCLIRRKVSGKMCFTEECLYVINIHTCVHSHTTQKWQPQCRPRFSLCCKDRIHD